MVRKEKDKNHKKPTGKAEYGVNKMMGQWKEKMEQVTKDMNDFAIKAEKKVQSEVEKAKVGFSKNFSDPHKQRTTSKPRVSLFKREATQKKICGPKCEAAKTTKSGVSPTSPPSTYSTGMKLEHDTEDIITTPVPEIDEEIEKSIQLGSETRPFDQKEFIRKALEENFIFDGLDDTKIETMVNAFDEHKVKTGEHIITQGDEGDYFYILKDGIVKFIKDDEDVATGRSTDDEICSFGELALLYSSPRNASVVAVTDCNLFKVDQKTFQYVMRKTITDDQTKIQLIRGIPELADLDADVVTKLANVMTTETFGKDEYLYKQGDKCESFYIVMEGSIDVTNIVVGGPRSSSTYQDHVFTKGQSFGWFTIAKKMSISADVKAAEDNTTLLFIDHPSFSKIVGNLENLAWKAQMRRLILSIPIFRDSKLTFDQIIQLVAMIQTKDFPLEMELCEEGYETNAALYLVYEGNVYIEEGTNGGDVKVARKCIDVGGYFGEDQLLADHMLLGEKDPIIEAKYTAIVAQGSKLGMITLDDCRKVLNTTLLGLGKDTSISPIDESIRMEDLTRHVMLGSGSFGQVWLVSSESKKKEDGKHDKGSNEAQRQIYALKVQSKYQLVESGQAEAVVAEKNIMACLSHPFIIRLYNTYQDDQRVYMLESLLQGGELGSIMSNGRLNEQEAKFYAAGILEGMTYMHSRRIIHRDLKPENVLINSNGYPVLIDLGFAKYVADKTYTFCGTPMYIAPEVITQSGHDKGADHWSWACIIYEMIEGTYPFYKDGMDELGLFKNIVRGRFELAGYMSFELKLLLISLFVPERTRRLGSLADGWKDIFESYWFNDVNFDDLRKQKLTAPWVPNVKNPLDSSNFDQKYSKKDDLMERIEPNLTKEEEGIFKSF